TATTSMLAGPSCMIDGLTDVFYSFNSGSNTSLMFNLTLGTLEAYGVQVLEGCTGAEVACMPDQVSGIFAVTPNTDYILRLLTLPTFAGTYTICVETAPDAPDNDDCANATVLVPAETCVPTSASSLAATESMPAASCSGWTSPSANDVWFQFEATSTGHIIEVSNGTFDMILGIYSDCGTLINCVDDFFPDAYEILTQNGLIVGNTYYVRVYGYNGATGTFDICVMEAPAPPANDDCTNATVLVPAETCVPSSASSLAATESMPAASCSGWGSPSANDVWFQFVAADETHTIQVQNSTFDVVLGLYSDCGTLISCVDDVFPDGYENLIVSGLTVGNTYYVRVYGYNGGTGTFDICVVGGAVAPECTAIAPDCVLSDEDAYMTVILDDDWCCFNEWDDICQEAFDEISNACEGACLVTPP